MSIRKPLKTGEHVTHPDHPGKRGTVVRVSDVGLKTYYTVVWPNVVYGSPALYSTDNKQIKRA